MEEIKDITQARRLIAQLRADRQRAIQSAVVAAAKIVRNRCTGHPVDDGHLNSLAKEILAIDLSTIPGVEESKADSGEQIQSWEDRMTASGKRECESLAIECMEAEIKELRAALSQVPQAEPSTAVPGGWVSVEDKLPEVGLLVMVYAPPTAHDWPDSINISFDCIDPDADEPTSWLNHNEHYEHYCCVGKPEGSIGPSEKAPYTHWQPMPPSPDAAPAQVLAAEQEAQPVIADKNYTWAADWLASQGVSIPDFRAWLATLSPAPSGQAAAQPAAKVEAIVYKDDDGHVDIRYSPFSFNYGFTNLYASPVAAHTATHGSSSCEWKLGDHENMIWESSCGEAWSFIDGGPNENGIRFCQGCGKPMKQIDAAALSSEDVGEST